LTNTCAPPTPGHVLSWSSSSPGWLPIGAKVQSLLAMEVNRLCAALAESAETATAIVVIKRMEAAIRIVQVVRRSIRETPITAFVAAGNGEVQ
jgi:hypothetical protein